MSQKWLKKESKQWLEKGIVTEDQVQQIISLYPENEKSRFFKVLPILASILFGLSILSFIASNWNGIHDMLKLVLIIIFMIGFYLAGERLIRNGKSTIGIPLIGLGVITFGAGIILLGQTFHIISYDARAFLFWGLASIAATFFFKSRFLYLLSAVIVTGGQWYSFDTFNHYSLSILLVTLLLLGILWHQLKSVIVSFTYVLSLMVQFLVLIFSSGNDDFIIFVGLIPITFYMVGELLKSKKYAYPFQFVPMAVAFVVTLLFSFHAINDPYYQFMYLQVYSLITILYAVTTLLLKYKNNSLFTSYQLVIFISLLTCFYGYNTLNSEFIYLVYLFLFSFMVLVQGFNSEENRAINLGTFLFIFTTMTAYFNLAWEFMSKSLLFLTGAIILVGLHFLLQKKKKDLFQKGGE